MKKIIWLSIILIFWHTPALYAQSTSENDPNSLAQQATSAYLSGDYARFLECYQKIAQLLPHNPGVIYNLACGLALNGNKDEAIRWLNKLVDWGYEYNITQDSDFNSIRNSDEFQALLKKVEMIRMPISHSEIAFTIAEKDLIPENIAYDPVEKTFYLGSLFKAKIISRDKAGGVANFTAEHQDGLWSVIGMKVDASRRILWVCSSTQPIMKGFEPGTMGRFTGLFKYSLIHKNLIKKYVIEDTTRAHLFNDCVVNSAGDVFITDYLGGAIYKISQRADELELLVQPDNFAGPNGIDLSADEKFLFVGHASGVAKINVNTNARQDIVHSDQVSLAQIDGLYFYKNSLIAIQTGQNRLNRYYLNKALDRVEKAEIIEAHHPKFAQPTTGVLVGNIFYLIANSQYNSFNPDGSIFPMERLQDIVILKARL